MKALKDCKWEVFILRYDGMYYFIAGTKDNAGCDTAQSDICGKDRKTKQQATKDWIKFAELNGITNFKIKE